jgi:hydroxymethylglutaryl-CoA lyase
MIRLVEVGPRDGLQNEPGAVPLGAKIELIERLAAAGLPAVEAGSFVNPKLVPQMADSGEIYTRLHRRAGTAYPALVANMRGLEAALAVGVAEIAVFVSASEGFSQRNIACSVEESFARVGPVVAAALAAGMAVRGYASCVIACPFDGPTPPARAAAVAARLAGLGCYEISLGDTIGIGTAADVRRLIDAVTKDIPRAAIAMHFHDTYGQGVANILASLEAGITVFDSSVAGLGGCPFAPGATGNVATEDVLHLLHGLGLETGVDLPSVAAIGAWISGVIGRPNNSRAGRALTTKT